MHLTSVGLIESSALPAGGGVQLALVPGLVRGLAVAQAIELGRLPARSYPSLPGTPSSGSVADNGYPQGEKKNASRSSRSIRRAVSSLA